ncbi:MAG: hypothetical protein IKU28_06265, partial [Erysipelotrichaceae bacterium]|nr:hypothetical protein [Erysipelotrichaceae bacterium]
MIQKMLQKIITCIMIASVVLTQMPFVLAHADAHVHESAEITEVELNQMRSSVSTQITKYLKSIDQSNADDTAALAMAKHGVSGRGKALNVGASHALTAALMNSEVAKNALIEGVAKGIYWMQNLSMDHFDQVRTSLGWYEADLYYSLYYFTEGRKVLNDGTTDPSSYESLVDSLTVKSIKGNDYDKSMIWIAGNAGMPIYITKTSVTADKIKYHIKASVEDRFDFRNNNESVSKDIASLLGSVFFKEFDWTATIEFDVEVPNHCKHSSGNYRLVYDTEAVHLLSYGSDGYTENDTTKYEYVDSTGKVGYYYQLDRTITLMHDQPWVMEYTSRNTRSFIMSINERTNKGYFPYLYVRSTTDVYFVDVEYRRNENGGLITHYSGIKFSDYFKYNTKNLYTFRYENVIHADGSNMIYLTVYNNDTQQVMMESVPLDDYYATQGGETISTSSSSKMLSGKDIYFNYIGNKNARLNPDYLDLRIYEKGLSGDLSSFSQNVTKPTCTSKGYTTFTCE